MNRLRDKAKPTKHQGVKVIEPGAVYVIRGSWTSPKTGRKTAFHEQVNATSSDAAAAMRLERLQDAKSGTEIEPVPRLLVFAKSWLNSKRDDVEPSTHEKYVYAVAHIAERFGDHFLDRITTRDVLEWRGELRASFGNETINGWIRTFKTLMGDAVREHRLPFNTVEGVKMLPVDKPEKCLTEEELDDLLGAMNEVAPQWYPLTLTLALTGMRPGAATALRWSNIDFERKCITVDHAHWRGIVGRTKTGNRREVGLPPILEDVLQKHRRRLIVEQHPGLSKGWVFSSSKGTLRNSGCLTKPLQAACERAGIDKPVSSGWFRHTFSNLVSQRAGMRVQKAITGHTTDRMALHYSDVTLNERQAVVTDIASKLSHKASHGGGPTDLYGGGGDDDGSEA